MLTLTKFLVTVGLICGLIFAVIFSLATFVQPGSRETGFTVRADKMMHDQR